MVCGIARSGTTYCCKLVHQFDNCVAVHEPAEVLQSLQWEDIPYGVASYYRRTRDRIASGRPIMNSLVDGEVTEDPARSNIRQSYVPSVRSRENFILATKYNRSFLIRFDEVEKVMPDARFIALVRNPIDTIASWKTCPFPHLNNADLIDNPVGSINSKWLAERYRPTVLRITEIADLGQRRAALWKHCAELVLEHSSKLTIIRYEDLIERPEPTMARVFEGLDPGQLRKPLIASKVRTSRDKLSTEDLYAIMSTCSDVASALGYDLQSANST